MEEENNLRTFGFMTSSSILHAALALLVIYYATDIMSLRPLPTTTEIEILGTGDGGQTAPLLADDVIEKHSAREAAVTAPPAPAAPSLPQAAIAPATVTKPATAPSPDIETTPVAEVKVPVAVPAKSLPTKPVATAKAPSLTKPAVPSTPSKSTSAPSKSFAASKPAMTAPTFSEELDDAPTIPVANYEDNMADDDLNDASEKERSEHAAQLAAVKADMDAAGEEVSKEKTNLLAAVEKQNKEEDEKMAAIVADKKKAAQIAAQKAEQNRIAEAQAAADSRTNAVAAAQAAQAAQAAKAAEGQATQAQAGQSQLSGSGRGGGVNETGSSNVRGIQDLKQSIGNKKPEYDKDDRFNGRQGQVVFQAYVTSDGVLQNFELIQSSGHKTLDLKTLKALRAWKFHPGQEGIVEIPFKWDLVGGAQEMPTSLRRKIGQY